MLNNLVIDNFFDDPDKIRKIALSRNYRYGNDNRGRDGWRGERTLPIRSLDKICPCCNQEINSNFYSEQKLLIDYSKKIFNICEKHFQFNNSKNLTITSYFHICTEETLKSLTFFSQDKFHKDSSIVGGVVYLTPNAPPSAGTSILHAEKTEFVDIENKYNRLIAYESQRIHGLSDAFGTTKETGRLTFTFFIHSAMDLFSYD